MTVAAVSDGGVNGFYPLLYLNMGKAHEDLGHREQAKRYHEIAAGKTSVLPEGRYGDIVRDGIQRGLRRVS
jgi:hypothetical protein